MDIQRFNDLPEKYAEWASWAIWNEDKLGDVSMFLKKDECDKLHTDIVIVGLNPSPPRNSIADKKLKWAAFHPVDRSPINDKKLCSAFAGTKVWGAYMTDLFHIKTANCKDIDEFLEKKENTPAIREQIVKFQKELDDVGVTTDSTFILLGKQVHRYFTFFIEEKFNPIKRIDLPHYSYRFGKKGWTWVDEAKEAIKDL